MKLALTIQIVVFTAVMAWSFTVSLPNWCAHPERPGNWIVQPLCK